jgi:TolB-like protein/class 3 adenylate cyclase/Tfp pilus assembly protein PilF
MPELTPRRRLAAILAADVVGYSGMMQADEAGTLAALKARRTEILQPLVSKHHGRIIKVMGDGVLVEFGSAVEAVSCAVALQEAMAVANEAEKESRQVVLRIGINLGDVMVEGGDLYGDGVNIAARLQALADPGSVVVSGKVRQETVGKLECGFEHLGDQKLKNMPEPVRVYRVSAVSAPSRLVMLSKEPGSKPSIAALPFPNMSGDPEQEYFSDGITEDIITELSRFRNLIVIARNSSFSYKGKTTKTETIARELGVQYLLEGSVRRAGQRIRVTAQLISAANDKHVWAERYDRELSDIFAVQDEIARNIVGTMAVELEAESLEQARRKSPEDVQAYEHWLRGKSIIYSMGQGIFEARQHFERAVAADTSYARAHSGLAQTYMWEALEYPLPGDPRTVTWNKASMHALTAVKLDDADCEAHLILAWYYLYRSEWDRSQEHLDRAVKLNPNAADVLAHSAYVLQALGNAERAVDYAQTALTLNPHSPDWYLGYLCDALFTARRYAEALAVRLRAPGVMIASPFYGAAILGQMGRLEEAKQWVDIGMSGLERIPGGALAIAKGRVVELLLENNPYRRPEDRDHFAEGLRKAGVPG